MILLSFLSGKKATASCFCFFCICTVVLPDGSDQHPLEVASHRSLSTQQQCAKATGPWHNSLPQKYLFFHCIILGLLLAISYDNSDEENGNICTFIYSTWQLSKDRRSSKMNLIVIFVRMFKTVPAHALSQSLSLVCIEFNLCMMKLKASDWLSQSCFLNA